MEQKKYDIMIHLWWEKQIRKITIVSEDTRIEMWFRNFGHITLEERRTRDVFSGITQGLTGSSEGGLTRDFCKHHQGWNDKDARARADSRRVTYVSKEGSQLIRGSNYQNKRNDANLTAV